ncbi:ubiquitin-like modifier-activating enzyme ATG7 [Marchantia polymorpha subsp. ruderalis]|uniref:Ubiquitin-like modifier-activating enzyme ATG7 n=1 Tax=Marchantia polymorpha TaxID=3197 RepID=A0A2R6XGM5_MARPO|nr:hypothetical protein MARPO_0015s0071 [Marchantia polymorpha]BBN01496.1 hypothetical protein Mp_2g07850 [Marchantia polymorpha subsp. ruderalis]|eukprot:PTQ45263.1 hypothetical protein MARPO_0015s0071 [Marchantia polymorpha]
MGLTEPSDSEALTPSGHGPDEASEVRSSASSTLMFAPWQSAVDEGFWHRMASFKLETQRLDEHPVPVSGFFAPCSHPQIPSHLQLLEESLPPDPGGSSSTSHSAVIGNRNKCPAPGTLYNTNTLESFTGMDRPSLLKSAALQIWEDIHSGKAEEDSNVLNRFLLISFADLKKWSFLYWFAFPAIVLTPSATVSSCTPVSMAFSEEESTGIRGACSEWRSTETTASSPFFLLHFTSDGAVNARPIRDWKVANEEGGKVISAYYDPYNRTYPGWPLRNFLALAVVRWEVTELRVLCYREKRGFLDPELSLVVDVELPKIPEWKVQGFIPKGVGWELNSRGKARPRIVHLAASMDPERAANQAADLNLKLMRWRLLPSLNIPLLSSTKCLLLGAGTLGCHVARNLLPWGIRHITFVDYGKVAMSNPCRQSLYNLEDCLNGGKPKAEAAVASLKRIGPVEARGLCMSIPMPGHSVGPAEVDSVLADCSRLKELVDEHDIVFLLTDTRESRWLPTLLCAAANKNQKFRIQLRTKFPRQLTMVAWAATSATILWLHWILQQIGL